MLRVLSMLSRRVDRVSGWSVGVLSMLTRGVVLLLHHGSIVPSCRARAMVEVGVGTAVLLCMPVLLRLQVRCTVRVPVYVRVALWVTLCVCV